MKNMVMILVACFCLTTMIGCSSAPALSMNKRMAYVDSGATLASAVVLDQVALENFDKVKGEVVKVCTGLKKFLDDGLVIDLPIDVAKTKIEKFMISKGWSPYIGLVDVCFAWIEVQRVPLEKLGVNNIIIIKEGLSGVERQALRAKKEWARPFGSSKVDTK